MQGVILEVSSRPVQFALAADALTGSTTFTLATVSRLPASGSLTAEVQVPLPDSGTTSVLIPYSSFDPTTFVVTLVAPTTVDQFEGDVLVLFPLVIEKWATVSVDVNDDAIFALVPGTLSDKLSEGVRDSEEQELVVIDQQAGDWIVADILGTKPMVDSDSLNIIPDSILGDSLGQLQADVAANAKDIESTNIELGTTSLTAYAGTTLASTADGRVSMSDYEPTPTDVSYYATANDGTLIPGIPFSVVNRSLTSNVATLIVQGGGVSMAVGQLIIVTGLGAPFDGIQTVTAVDSLSVSYAVVNSNIASLTDDFDPAVLSFNTFFMNRTEGSIWFVRTRARKNLITNPSFETNVSDWTIIQASVLREAVDPVVGSYTMKITNNATPGDHYVTWDNGGGASRQAAVPGQVWGASMYLKGVSGSTTNKAVLKLLFLDSGGSTLATFSSPSASLSTTVWNRYYISGAAPASTAYVIMTVSNPNDSAVWRVDAGLLEISSLLGRYFDGRSFDASWDGVVDDSPSTLAGGKISRAYELDDGAWIEKFFTGSMMRFIDATYITVGTFPDSAIPTLFNDNSIPIDKLQGTPVVASENIAAGDLVNIHNVGGLFRMRLADADGPYRADGFVLDAVSSGAIGFMRTHGYNPFVTGLTPGPQFLSTAAGKSSSSPANTVNTLSQRVGTAAGSTVLEVVLGPSITIK